MIVLQGSVDFTMDRELHSVGEGEAALASPGTIHAYQGQDSRCLVFIFPQRVAVTGVPLDTGIAPLRSHVIRQDHPGHSMLRGIVELGLFAIDPARRGSPGKAAMLAALTNLYLGIFGVESAGQASAVQTSVAQASVTHESARPGKPGQPESAVPARGTGKGSVTDAKIRKALGYMEQHFARPVSLEEVASATGLSSWHFSRQFHRYTGIGFTSWLTLRRLAEAERLLSDSDFSILDIADESGFGGMRALDRAFRSRRGMSPREYRATLGINRR